MCTKNAANAKYVVKFDVLKAEQVAKAKESFSGGALGGMMGGLGGSILSSVKTKDASEVWSIGGRIAGDDGSVFGAKSRC
jgi:predicted lipid-binding transport protein (Tim44 family)